MKYEQLHYMLIHEHHPTEFTLKIPTHGKFIKLIHTLLQDCRHEHRLNEFATKGVLFIF